ncbi:PREDICTED: ras and Rab interactor-like protein [Gekko japonicus]|uniref:Ras and Rab interactor-like protein n=1 Tax=Gekko japonicus TaxID=146911 RepID=A0ABM1L3G3_GEKJA|nr:PREDICTED: ras and Rab interactor-like protein [Gekko japonicus]
MSDSVSSDNRGPTENVSGPSHAFVNGRCDGSLSLLDRLSATRGVWELLGTLPRQATELLAGQASGTFIITRDVAGDSRVISIRTREGGADAVRCFSVLDENSAVYLEGSHLRFRDLLDLVAFHMVSRDILPDLLRIPDAFQLSCKSELDALAALGTKFWTMPLKLGPGLASAEEGSQGSNGEPHRSGQPDGPVQVIPEEGALCIINPLFLSVHGDACWLNSAPDLCRTNSRRGTLRLRDGRGSPVDSGSAAVPCKQEDPPVDTGSAAVPCRQEDPECLERPGSPEEEKATEKGGSVAPSGSVRWKPFLRSLAMADSANVSEELPASPDLLQKEVKSPHRVSWIEAASATAPPCCPPMESGSESSPLHEPLVLPPIPELDSLSLSSMEDEGDSLPLTATHKKRRSSAALTYKVLHRLSAVGSTLGGLLSTERRISNRVQELAQEPMSYLGGLVQSFVGHVLRGSGMRHPTSTDMLQEIRQMISNLKGYLCESSELRTICEHSEAEEMDLGSVVEAALYKCILKPLRDSIYAQLLDFRTRDGSLARLRGHQATMSQQTLAELGVTAGVPDGAGLERIRTKLGLMHQAYSPKKKETQMLKACKLIYEAMNQAAGRTEEPFGADDFLPVLTYVLLNCDIVSVQLDVEYVMELMDPGQLQGEEPFGADDFLPVLTYVLLNCDIVSVQLDVEYVMELMDPSQLQGEGGYYLTTWFGVLYHIANFQPAAMVTRQISIEAQRSIHQWHRRRTIHHHHGYRGHSQNILFVSFHEPFSNQKSISTLADMTTASICEVCAKKYGVPDPEAYGLFLVSGDSSQLLADDTCPRRLRSDILQAQGPPVSFIYKPKGGAQPDSGLRSLQNPGSSTETQEPFEGMDTGQTVAD